MTIKGLIFALYLINSILLIIHEMDSAYHKEWELFKLPGGITGFLALHFPLLFIMLYGLIKVYDLSTFGLIISLLLSSIGIFAFCIHGFFILKGRDEFKAPISIFILGSTLVVSIAQLIVTIILLLK